MKIELLGWNSYFNDQLLNNDQLNDLLPARVVRENKDRYVVQSELGEFIAELSGRLRFDLMDDGSYPTVGDWVMIRPFESDNHAVINFMLNRRSCLSRKSAGEKTSEQVMAANIDTVFILTALDDEFKPNRIERYLTVVSDSKAKPVLLLNKIDICPDPDEYLNRITNLPKDIPVHTISAVDGSGLEQLDKYIVAGQTIVFIGSSGVGKSTLINYLIGDARQDTFNVRKDSKGRHTTTTKDMIIMPNGAILIDTPGLRELQLWGDGEGLKQAYDDIEVLADKCRFNDCIHESENGCAVQEAIKLGTLDEKRFNNYLKQKREIEKLALRKSGKAKHIERKKAKKFSKMVKQVIKIKKQERGW